MRFFVAVFLCLLSTVPTYAQQGSDIDNVWSLQRCVQYAVDHNISIKQDSLTARLAGYTLRQSQYSQAPVISASGNLGRSYGRSINPTTNQFVEGDYDFISPSGSANVLVFGWLQVRNTIAKNKYSMMASLADLDQLRDDVSLNVANGFLAAVLAQEQINVSKSQVDLSKAQLSQTKSFADAGRLPELNVAQLESQLATDSSNLINAIANYNSSILDLKTLLNLDFSVPFSIKVPDVEVSEQIMVSSTQPEEIFQKARAHFGSIKASELRVQAAEKGVTATKGNLYPQLNVGYQIGTNYASNYLSYQPTNQLNGVTPIGITGKGDTVYQPSYKILTPLVPFGTQFDNNIRQSVFVNLNIPILNGWNGQYAVRQARINLAQQQLTEYNAALTLKQNVYKAHNTALNCIQKYYAAKRADDAAQRALDFARKRYDLGLTSTVDLLVTQSQEYTAASNLVSAKYNLIFSLKVIDYYMGKELKL